MIDERAIIQLGITTSAGSSHGKLVQVPIRLVIVHLFMIIYVDSRPGVNESTSLYK